MNGKLQWNQNVLENVFRELYDLENAKKPDFIPKMFGVENSVKDTESLEGIGGEGLMEEWGKSSNQVFYADVDELWQKYFKHVKYSLGRQIDRDFVDDLKLTAIKDRIVSMADAVYKTQQYQGVESFNNFNLTATATDFRGRVYNAAGPDTKALCATDHPYSPTNATDVQSNLGTSALSIDAWDTTAVNMQTWTDDQGNVEGANPNLLICHPYNKRKAFQIAGIPGKGEGLEPGSADNNINVYEGDIQVVVNPFLRNRYAWFAIDDSRMRRFHKWYWRRKPENGSITDFDTETLKFKTIGRWSKGYINWSWIYGHNATK